MKIKPCPFCGCNKITTRKVKNFLYQISCDVCGATGPIQIDHQNYSDEENIKELIERWNFRHNLDERIANEYD